MSFSKGIKMAKRQISNLDLKVKLTREYLDNGGVQKIMFKDLLEDLAKVKPGQDGKTDPDTVSTSVNAFMLTILADQLQPPFYSPQHISEYKSTLQKSNSFDQENIDTEEQFDKIYEEYKDKTDFLFRGQREAKWRLYSKLQRHWIFEKFFEKPDTYQAFLERLIENGRKDFGDQILQLLEEKHIDADNDISVLSYLQHHGCPTPLLDWTYKFQNALFFSIDGVDVNERKREIDDYCSVYFIEERYFENGSMRKLIEDSIENMQEEMLLKEISQIAEDEEMKKQMVEKFNGRKIIDLKRIKGSGLITHLTQMKHMITFPATYFCDKDTDADIVFSLNNSKNILNQAGVFTWNANEAKPFEMVVSEQNQLSDGKEIDITKPYILCTCFNINKKLADYVRKRLEADGITRELIYPTPDISTRDVFEKSKSGIFKSNSW